ncbi:NEAT domain-containing protein [Bacillus manliponensis]|uniref:NEAT domain-containing protein n=1 Tax=Bacillus manliponensis TaxID=574376 RepID=UPI00068ADD6B
MIRYLKVMIAMFLAVFTFVTSLQPLTVQAATQLADGEYAIDFQVLKDSSDEVSKMNEYTVSPGILKVKDGKQRVSFTLKNSSWITQFQTEKAGNFADVDIVSEDTAADTRVVEFDVEDVAEKLNAKVKVDIPSMGYHHLYDVRIAFDTNSIKPVVAVTAADKEETVKQEVQEEVKQETKQEETAEIKQEVTEKEKQEIKTDQNKKEDLATKPDPIEKENQGQKPDQKQDLGQQSYSTTIQDGEYTLDYTVLKDKTDQASMMDGYTEGPATLKVKDGQKKVSITLKNSSWMPWFKTEVNGTLTDVKVVSEDTVADKRVVEFDVEDLEKKLNAQIRVDIDHINYHNTYAVQIKFDTATMKKVDVPVTPEKPSGEEIADGEYTLDYTILKNGTDTPSMMDTYTEGLATLKVKDGKKKVSITLKNSSWMPWFKTEVNGTLTDVEVVSVDTVADKRIVAFDVANLEEKLNAQIRVDIDHINYHNTYAVQIKFDKSTMTKVETGGEPEQPEQPSVDPVADGEYTLDYTILKNGTDEPSMMDGYTEGPATLKVKDGKKKVSITFTNSSWITWFKTEKNSSFVDAVVVSEDVAANKRVVEFDVDDLTKKLNAKVRVDIDMMNYHNEYDVQIAFDKTTMKPVEPGDGDGGTKPEEPGGGDGGTKPEEPGGGDGGTNPEEPSGEVIADGEYTLDYTILKNGTDTPSMMDGYTEGPATLKVQNGEKKVSITLINSSWITWFKTESGGSFIDTTTVSTDTAADKRVVEFDVEDLEKKLNAKVKVDIPSMNYHNEYDVQVQFDKGTMTPGGQPEKPEKPEKPSGEVIADGEYTLDYTILKNGTDTPSMMDGYTEGPATLKVQNGEKKVSITLINSSWITWFKTESGGSFIDTTTVSTDTAADKRVVEFDVEDLEKKLNAKVKVDIPSMNYHNEYDVQVQFDKGTMTPGGQPEKPEKPNDKEFEDGKYNIEFKVSGDGAESIKGYTESKAEMEVKDGKKKMSITLKNSSHITWFKVEKNGSFVDATVVSEDKVADKRIVEFEVDDVTKALNAKIRVDIPIMNAYKVYSLSEYISSVNTYKEYDVKFTFDKDTVKPVEKPEKPNNGEIADGEYALDYTILKNGTDTPSMMDTYTEGPATLKVKNGEKKVAITLTNSSWITWFKTDNGSNFVDAVVVSEDKAANKRVVEFDVKDLEKKLNAKVKVDIPDINYHNEYDVQVAFDKNSMKPIEDGSNNGGNNNGGSNNGGNNNGQPNEPIDPKNLKDGEYDIAFRVLKDQTDSTSMMNQYVVSPARLTVKDGKKSIAMKLKNSSWITKFQTEQNGTFPDAQVVSEDKAKDTRVVSFDVEDLEKKLNAKVKVDIPHMNYHNFYDVQIQFDPKSIGAVGTVKPNETPKGNGNNKTENPNFDRNADGNKETPKGSNDTKKEPNVKTADMSQLSLYVMLLLGSLVILVRKYRTGRL